jgi:peptidyl-tRNA hydrolase
MGIGPDYPVGDGAKYVLSQLKKAQLEVVDRMLDDTAEAVRVILADGVEAAMSKFNRKTEEEATSD